MPDIETLRKDRDFRRVLSRGRRHRAGGIVVARSPGLPGPPRLGFVVSKRSGNAVTRNRIRRRLRSAVGGGQLQPGNDYVIIANKEVAEAPFGELRSWIERALARVEDA